LFAIVESKSRAAPPTRQKGQRMAALRGCSARYSVLSAAWIAPASSDRAGEHEMRERAEREQIRATIERCT
jgi:hypothetical protein